MREMGMERQHSRLRDMGLEYVCIYGEVIEEMRSSRQRGVRGTIN